MALFGVLLVGITPNPPVTVRDWLQIVAGAALTAAMVTAAVRDWVRRSASRALGRRPANRLRDWRLWAWVLAPMIARYGCPRLRDPRLGVLRVVDTAVSTRKQRSPGS